MYTIVNAVQEIHKEATMIRILFNVTTCLYLTPNIRARSLSTLIAVSVNKDTQRKIVVRMSETASK